MPSILLEREGKRKVTFGVGGNERRSNGDAWWWNDEDKEEILRGMHTRRHVRIVLMRIVTGMEA